MKFGAASYYSPDVCLKLHLFWAFLQDSAVGIIKTLSIFVQVRWWVAAVANAGASGNAMRQMNALAGNLLRRKMTVINWGVNIAVSGYDWGSTPN